MARSQQASHRPSCVILIKFKTQSMFVPWKLGIKIIEYQIDHLGRQNSMAPISPIIKNHLTENSRVGHSGEESSVAGYAVESPCIFIMDSSANRLRTLWFLRSKNCDLELLSSHG